MKQEELNAIKLVTDSAIRNLIDCDNKIHGFIYESEETIIEIESGYAEFIGGEENPYEETLTYFYVYGSSDFCGNVVNFEKEYGKQIKLL